MTTICQIAYVYTTCTLEHSSTTFELPILEFDVRRKWAPCEYGLCSGILI